jgi:hypothetical protein
MSGYEQPIRLTLRGIQYYQAALKEIIGDRQRCVEPVTLRPEAEQSGKYVGRYRAQVSAGGLIIGVIPAADCADDKGMQRAFARGLAAGFVTLVRYPERIWGTVTLG